MRARAALPLLFALSVAGCNAYPMDPEGTTQHIEETGSMRTGIVASPDMDEGAARDFAGRLARHLSAKPDYATGSAAILLRRLEEGELDIVVGDFAADSPWKEKAALTAPIVARNPPKDEPVLRGAVRKGENRWLMFIARNGGMA